MLSRTHFFSPLHLAIQNQLHLKPSSSHGPAIWTLCLLAMSKERCRIVSGGSLKRAKGTFPDIHSKACLADHQNGPHQMPPPRPLEGKVYEITLSPVRLATDLEVGTSSRGKGRRVHNWPERGESRKEGNPLNNHPATSAAFYGSITFISWGQGCITLLDHDSQ